MDDFPRRPQPQQSPPIVPDGAANTANSGSNLFASPHLPLPHPSPTLPPIHPHPAHRLPHPHHHPLQAQRFPPNAHSLHPSLSPGPALPNALYSQSQAQAYAHSHWQHRPSAVRDDFSLSSPSSTRPARPRLDAMRSDSYQDSRSSNPPSADPMTASPTHPSPTTVPAPPAPSTAAHSNRDPLPPASDFVKKLFKMLEDSSFQHVVSWGPEGDCFVVKDMNDFTKSILPRMFKHSNFASFVRQLNKYDFHKVKNAEGTPGGDHAWTFKHPDFHARRRDALENIKRKVPSQRKAHSNGASATSAGAATSIMGAAAQSAASFNQESAVPREEHDLLVDRVDELTARLREVEQSYQNVLTEMVNFQRSMAQQDSLMQNLIQYFLQFENGKLASPPFGPSTSPPQVTSHSVQNPQNTQAANPDFLPNSDLSRGVNGNGNFSHPSYSEQELARASFEQMNEISRRAHDAGLTFQLNGNGQPYPNGHINSNVKMEPNGGSSSSILSNGAPMTKEELSARRAALNHLSEEFQRTKSPLNPNTDAPTSPGSADRPIPGQGPDFDPYQASTSGSAHQRKNSHAGLQVFTVGHLMPRETLDGENTSRQSAWNFDSSMQTDTVGPHSSADYPSSNASGTFNSSESVAGPSTSRGSLEATTDKQTLRVRRSTFVPSWAVPPRVLLVEDDAVSRRLSSKFLQVFGCTIDVAVDGESAVNKMNLEKYDLVLMDIVMPKLDGVSATSLIRKFDPRTPIISMTSNSKPNDILYYYSQGMNDILPKPFTKEGLLGMLEKHLMHLKVIQAMRKSVPRGLGIPPLNDENFDQALMVASHQQLQQQQHQQHPESGLFITANGNNHADGAEEDEARKPHPLAGMGLSDEHYAMLLQNIVGGVSSNDGTLSNGPMPYMEFGLGLGGIAIMEKRPLDDVDDRDGKRGRFEVLE